MSGATKKIEQVPNRGPKQKSRPKQKSLRSHPETIKDVAFEVFMMKDYMKRYHEKHSFPTAPFPSEAVEGVSSEWDNMTDADKDKWIEYTKKRFAEGATLGSISLECVATYNRRN